MEVRIKLNNVLKEYGVEAVDAAMLRYKGLLPILCETANDNNHRLSANFQFPADIVEELSKINLDYVSCHIVDVNKTGLGHWVAEINPCGPKSDELKRYLNTSTGVVLMPWRHVCEGDNSSSLEMIKMYVVLPTTLNESDHYVYSLVSGNIKLLKNEIKRLSEIQKIIKSKHGKPNMMPKKGFLQGLEAVYPDRAKHNVSLKLNWLYHVYEWHTTGGNYAHLGTFQYGYIETDSINREVINYIRSIKCKMLSDVNDIIKAIPSYNSSRTTILDKCWIKYKELVNVQLDNRMKFFNNIKCG